MKTIKLTALFVVLFTLSSCEFQFTIGSVTGNGNVIKEDHVLSGKFQKIKASNGLLVELVNSQEQKIIIEADENLHEYIEIEIDKGNLIVKTTKNIRKAKSKKVTIAYTELESIQASSGANVIGLSEMIADKFDLKTSSGAQIDVSVLAKEIDAQSSSGSSINIRGQARNFNTKASSGSSIDAKDLIAIYCVSKTSSGASSTLNVQQSLDAKASSGSEVKYYGEPEVVTQNTSSSGRVRKM